MRELATFGGGCFWCLEAVFADLHGVDGVVSGYAGGEVQDPTYEQVCGGRTGHAEVVQLRFDPAQISYGELLEVFFAIHDPTTLNRQGADVGTQYRSIILAHDAEQRAQAERFVAALEASDEHPDPVVTEIVDFTGWYPAETYHQEYFARNPNQPYCSAVVGPKVARFRRKFSERLRR